MALSGLLTGVGAVVVSEGLMLGARDVARARPGVIMAEGTGTVALPVSAPATPAGEPARAEKPADRPTVRDVLSKPRPPADTVAAEQEALFADAATRPDRQDAVLEGDRDAGDDPPAGAAANGPAPMTAATTAPVNVQPGTLQTTGFVKATTVTPADLEALAQLQAAARRAAGPDEAEPPVSGLDVQVAGIEMMENAATRGEAATPGVEYFKDGAVMPTVDTVASAAGPGGSTSGDPGMDSLIAADRDDPQTPTDEPITTASLPQAGPDASRVPAPRPEPPRASVKKAKAAFFSKPPNCGKKHAYWRYVNNRKSWYCR